jgi:hypothetical protein
MDGIMYRSIEPKKKCVQQAIISTFQTAPKKGETVYRVVPADSASVKEKSDVFVHRHRWVSEYVFLHYFDKNHFSYREDYDYSTWDEYCVDCRNRRRKVKEEKWIEEETNATR